MAKNSKGCSASFVSWLTVGVVLGVPISAAAKFQRYAATFCSAQHGLVGSDFWMPNDDSQIAGAPHVSPGIQNKHTTVDRFISCPIIDTDYLAHNAIKTVAVHGGDFHGSDEILVKACVTTWNASSGSCSAPQGSGWANYSQNSSAVLTSANSVFPGAASDFAYLVIKLPDCEADCQGTSSTLRGYYVQDS